MGIILAFLLFCGDWFYAQRLASRCLSRMYVVGFFIYYKQFKKLFSIQHIAGGFLFLIIVGSYYVVYTQYNSLSDLVPMLVAESSKRTGLVFGLWKTILHLFTFPFEMVYHFLPWSLLIVFFVRRDIIQVIRQDAFVTYNLLMFAANIIVYWVSVEVYPRYLLMFVPLIFSAFIYLYLKSKETNAAILKGLETIFFAACIVIAIGSFAPLFLERTQGTSYLYAKTLSVAFALVGLTWLYWRLKEERLLVLVVFLLVFRVGFNWFVLPDRNANDFGNLSRITSKEMGQKFKNQPLYVYKDTGMQYTNSLYMTIERQQIIPYRKDNFDKNALYIIDPQLYPEVAYEKLGEIKVRHGQLTYDIAKLK